MLRLYTILQRTRALPVAMRYGITTLLVLAGLGLRLALGDSIAEYAPTLFFPAILFSAALFDRGTGFWATLLGAVFSAYLALEPIAGLTIVSLGDVVALVLFIVIGLASAALLESMHELIHGVAEAHEHLLQAAERLREARHEKDILLQELGHRTKNDFQVLSSLTRIHSRNVEGEPAREALEAAADRIQVFGRAYERFDLSGTETVVSLPAYLGALCTERRAALADLKSVTLDVAIEEHTIPLRRAASLGLILNELLTNALKYAFPGDAAGTISVRLFREEDRFSLIVADNGVGIPEGTLSDGIGMRIVRLLASQLGGKLAFSPLQPGTRCELTFPALAMTPR